MLINNRNYEYVSILLIPFNIHFWSLVENVTCLFPTSWIRWSQFYLWLQNMFLFPSRKIFTSFLCKILNTHWRTLELFASKPRTTSMREKGVDRCSNAETTMCTQYTNNNVVAIEFSRRWEHKHSTLRTFV